MEPEQLETQQQQQVQIPTIKEKTKVRFTSLDITASISELKKTLVGQRVTNIYDLSNKMYMFKMGSAENKQSLIIENGVRFNTTQREIKTKSVPSAFTMKFRKYLRSKRLEDIRQVGVERVVVMTFGQDELTNHLILELYSQGNIILTDKDFRIIQLIRSHQFTETVKTAIHEIYPFDHAANLYLENFDTSEDSVRKVLQFQKNQEAKEQQERELKEKEEQEKKQKELEEKQQQESDGEDDGTGKKKKKKQNQQNKKNQQKKQPNTKKAKTEKEKKLKDVVFKLVPSLHQPVIDHIICELGINPNQKCSEEQIPDIQKCADRCIELLKDFMQNIPKGFLAVTDKSKQQIQEIDSSLPDKEQQKQKKNKIQYFDFSPILLNSHQGKDIEQNISFNEAIDLYFEKLILKDKDPEVILQKQKENIILKKFNNIIKDQDQRINALQREQESSQRKAQLIEQNIADVDALTNIVKQMKQGGLAWDKISKMINEGKENGDPMAELIHDMDFENNRITILLEDDLEDADGDMVPVEVDIDLNAYANAKAYYQNKKQNVKKEQKTQEAKQIALKQAEITAQREMEKQQIRENAITSRKTYWFEKFYWFISSENYLVISGRDASQNEVIIKKYMRKGDIYMHADYHGSSSTVIKNHKPNEPIPQQTMDEAAQASTCRSKAWDSKILSSVYWVYDHQVSKRAETGEYLPHGSFMIRGKKNFITPMRMEMGVVLLFKIEDNEAVQRHINDRNIKSNVDDEDNDKLKKLQLIQQESVSSQQTQQTDDLPTYEMLKQQSSVISQQLKIDEDKQVTLVETQPNQKARNQQQKQQGQNQKPQGMTKKQQQNLENQKKLQIKQKEAEKKGKKLSKADQKKLMKQLQEEDEDEDNKQQNQQHTVNVPRGKANKIKKMKQKYADQTEEEREMQMKLLGAKQVQGFDWKQNNKKKNKKKNKGQQQEDDDESDSEQDQEQLTKQQEMELKKQKELQEKKEREEQEALANKPKFLLEKEKEIKEREEERLRQKELKKQQQEKLLIQENQEQKNNKEEEKKEDNDNDDKSDNNEDSDKETENNNNIKEEEDQEPNTNNMKYEEEENQMNQELSELSHLVSFVFNEDVYRNMVFMCAPYNAIQNQNCKYRVKLVPGTQKKGRSGREIISYFQTLKESKPIEKKIMKCISEQEIINQMIGNVKIQAAGLMKIKLDQKAAKKKQKKDMDKAEMEIKEKGLLN